MSECVYVCFLIGLLVVGHHGDDVLRHVLKLSPGVSVVSHSDETGDMVISLPSAACSGHTRVHICTYIHTIKLENLYYV